MVAVFPEKGRRTSREQQLVRSHEARHEKECPNICPPSNQEAEARCYAGYGYGQYHRGEAPIVLQAFHPEQDLPITAEDSSSVSSPIAYRGAENRAADTELTARCWRGWRLGWQGHGRTHSAC